MSGGTLFGRISLTIWKINFKLVCSGSPKDIEKFADLLNVAIVNLRANRTGWYVTHKNYLLLC